jgi:hypothetical protein
MVEIWLIRRDRAPAVTVEIRTLSDAVSSDMADRWFARGTF